MAAVRAGRRRSWEGSLGGGGAAFGQPSNTRGLDLVAALPTGRRPEEPTTQRTFDHDHGAGRYPERGTSATCAPADDIDGVDLAGAGLALPLRATGRAEARDDDAKRDDDVSAGQGPLLGRCAQPAAEADLVPLRASRPAPGARGGRRSWSCRSCGHPSLPSTPDIRVAQVQPAPSWRLGSRP